MIKASEPAADDLKMTRGLGTVSLVVSLVVSLMLAERGTFVGATVTDIAGVSVLHAEATTFCLQIASNNSVLYDAGPGGTPSAQRC